MSVDIFSDEKNGLRSKRFYPEAKWLSVHTDIYDITMYQTKFDLIIFNHCLQFYPQAAELIQKYAHLLNPNGLMIILGVSVYPNEKKQDARVNQIKNYYQKKYNFDIYFYEGKGYFEQHLYKTLIQNNFKFIPYQLSLKGRLKATLLSQKHGILCWKK